MEEIVKALILLLPCVFTDIKTGKISCIWVGICGIASVILNFIFRWVSAYDMAGGALLGAAFLLFANLSREKLGLGDGVMIMGLGISLGFTRCFQSVLTAFLFSALTGGAFLLCKKKSREDTMAFAPFLGLGYVAAAVAARC